MRRCSSVVQGVMANMVDSRLNGSDLIADRVIVLCSCCDSRLKLSNQRLLRRLAKDYMYQPIRGSRNIPFNFILLSCNCGRQLMRSSQD